MILKIFKLNEDHLKKYNFFLLHGNNYGHIEDTLTEFFKPKLSRNVNYYEENDILNDNSNLIEAIFNKSLFENEKIIIIKRTTDKLYNLINDISLKRVEGVWLILISNNLDSKSKLRNFFEKRENMISIAFYEDDNPTLNLIASKFMRENKINISQKNINIIVERSRNSRQNLKNELQKIKLFMINKKNINDDQIQNLTNSSNMSKYSDLADNILCKNLRSVRKILNDNNFYPDDCLIILRTLLLKLKRILKLNYHLQKNQNLDRIIDDYKPPIFWKEKNIIKSQLNILNEQKIKSLIMKINKVEFLIKKKTQLACLLTLDFIMNIVT